MLKRYLLAPGPTPVPHEALLAMAAPMIHHRTPEFSAIFRSAADGARGLFGTEQPVLLLASTGTGGMEAAITNTLSRGDRVLVVVAGKFGERWAEICDSFGLVVDTIEVEWGKAVDPQDVAKALAENPETKAVLVQGSETSTTVLHPVAELAALTRDRDCLLIVDGITSVGVVDTRMDEVGIDVIVTGSQKAMMLPPGLALIALSEKAWRFAERADLPRYYFDLDKERGSLEKDTSAYTPAVSLVIGFKAVLDLIAETGGFAEVYRRHAILAAATRAGAQGLGLELLAPESPSPAATGVYLPADVDGAALVKTIRNELGVFVAGGQGHLKGKIIRLGHIGYADTFDVVIAISALEMALAKCGADVSMGSGVAAAQQKLLEMYGDGGA